MGIKERRKREKEARKKTILNAAELLFSERDYKTVSVAQIAHKAELSKGAVYLYFHSKEEIYAQILLDDLERFHNILSKSLQDGMKAAQMLESFSRIYVENFLSDREGFRRIMTFMLQTNNFNLSPNLNQCLIKATNKTIDIIGNILKFGVETGEFPYDTDIWQCRNIIWGMLNGIISLYLFTGKETNREKIIRMMINAGLNYLIDGFKQGSGESLASPNDFNPRKQ
jgi:AcrR family transcriptional regulator